MKSHVESTSRRVGAALSSGRVGTALLVASVAGICLMRAPAASAQVLLTQEEALALAFPDEATVERRTAFLTDEQLDSARDLAGEHVEVDQGVVTYYVGLVDGEPMAAAYFDAHRVRTLPEVAMVVVGREGRIRRVEVLRFAEPPEYMASEPWIDQLNGRALDDDLAVDRGIVNMTGATLTAGALTRASRRLLALHQVIAPFGDAPSGDGSDR